MMRSTFKTLLYINRQKTKGGYMSVEISTRAYLPFADARQIGYRIVYGEIRNDDVHKSHDDRTF